MRYRETVTATTFVLAYVIPKYVFSNKLGLHMRAAVLESVRAAEGENAALSSIWYRPDVCHI